MINSHQFQQAAKQFRAGRISLQEFTDLVIRQATTRKPNEELVTSNPQATSKGNTVSQPTQLPIRPVESHKGDFGRVVAIGGSVGMAGAIGLTGLATLRSGTGMVKVVVPMPIQTTVAALSPCLMTVGCQSENGCLALSSLDRIESETRWADVVALGPGMGRCKSLETVIPRLYATIGQPMVIDADGLNGLSDVGIEWSLHHGQRILTPHPGEFQRVVARKFTNRLEMEESAKEFANSAGLVVVLKGCRTLVTDGNRTYHNNSGNAGMATAGSGDVLTGVIASLVGQGIPAFDAAVLGVHIHGVAGDLAAESIGETSLIATDIIESLPVAFKQHANRSGGPIGFKTA